MYGIIVDIYIICIISSDASNNYEYINITYMH